MIYTFRGLQDRVLRYLDEASDQDVTRAVVKDALNQAHLMRCASHPWPFMLWDTPETITTVVGQQIYPLHQEFARPLYVYNTTTQRYLQEVPLRSLPEADVLPTGTSRGAAETFALLGLTAVRIQPTSATTLALTSSNALDNSSTYQVAVKGVDSTNEVTVELMTPNGATTVTSSVSFTKILGVTKAGEWNGTLTLRATTGGETLLRLLPTEMGRRYRQLYLFEPPAQAETISYRFFRQPLLLVNDYDVPEIPAEWSTILVFDALLLMAGYIDDISPTALKFWAEQSDALQTGMFRALTDGQTLGAYPRFVRSVDDEGWSNRTRLLNS
jgi:hypothetical protein